MNGTIARLVVRQGSTSQPEYQLGTQPVTIGRESGNEIVINDPEISRRHARITFQGGRYEIEDLGSTNGTFVNGRRISMVTPLNNNDTIDISDSVKIVYYGPGSDAGATMIEQPLDQVDTPSVGRYGQEAPPPAAKPPAAPPPARPQPAPPRPAHLQPAQPQPAPVRPPAAYGPPPAAPQPAARSSRRIAIGCGCLLLLALAACAASLLLLDAFAPDLIYCGPLQPVFELLGFAMSCA
jgi:pSer/pThr/pTyr-binding forkhead associated (FHA) protein